MTLSRRDMLVALLGLPAAAACVRRPAPRVEWTGGFVDPPFKDGHRLRDVSGPSTGAATQPAYGPATEVPVLILGGGIAGASAAWRLHRRGVKDFLLLEMEDHLGGTSRSGSQDNLRFPWGAHYVPAPTLANPDLIELLEQTGSIVGRYPDGAPEFAETHLCATPGERVFVGGFWHEGLYPAAGASQADLTQLTAFRSEVTRWVGFSGQDGRRAFSLPSATSSSDPAVRRLDEMSMDDWLTRKGLTSERLRWYVDYACRDDYGAELAQTSAWAALFYFAARIPDPDAESAEFLTWPEGNDFLARKMLAGIDPQRVRPSHMVTSIRPAGDGRRARVDAYDRQRKTTASWIAEKVVFAMPSFLRRHLVHGFDIPTYHPVYSPWLVANIHLSELPPARGYPIAWDNVIYKSRSLGYVVATHQLHRSFGPTVLTYYLPLSGADPMRARADLLSLSYPDACDAIVSELSRCHIGFEALIRRIDIRRWGHAMVRPAVGALFGGPRGAAARPVGPLHFAHTDLSGIALFEEAFAHGLRAADEVARSVRP